MKKLERTRGSLQRRREEILVRMGAVERDLRSARNPDSEERAVETENDPVLEGLDASGHEEIRQIDAALARIDDGSYGRCEACGAPIGSGRLEALPFATSCIDCARSEDV
jgi:DnaK suppressor protein